MRISRCLSGALLAGLAASFLQASGQENRAFRVTIDAGEVQGHRAPSSAGVVEFLGIPFAAAPVGNLRWRSPQPPLPWKGVRMAAEYGPACPQFPSTWLLEMLGRKQLATSEDCLYLNVWTPSLAPAKKLPVMVWIHGGGNVEGSGEMPPLGPVLARHGVVVVSLNYRLQALGYFSHPQLVAESAHHSSGNYGLLDQIAALQWVRRNISSFGGDPARVTAFGASSGSMDLCDLLASPLAKGWMQAAILQSGVCMDSMVPDAAWAEGNGERLAEDLGVKNSPDALVELRRLPVDRILQAAARDAAIHTDPVVDGWVLPQQPAQVFAKGGQARIPVLVGSNAQEVSIFASPLVRGKSYRPQTVPQYQQWLRQHFPQDADAVFRAYPAHTDSEVPRAFLEMATDDDFGFGSRLLAQESERAGNPAYLYCFTYVGTGQFVALGAFHSEESMLLSKKYWTSWKTRPEDERLSDLLIDYWTQFARTGSPNAAGLPEWPAYRAVSNRCQELGQHVGPIPVPRSGQMRVFQRILDRELRHTH